MPNPPPSGTAPASVFGLLKPYRRFIAALITLAIGANALNLLLPKIIGRGIDSFTAGRFSFGTTALEFGGAALAVFTLTVAQSLIQVFTSERVARDLRTQVAGKLSEQSFSYIQTTTPAKLLTNLTSDADLIKNFVSMGIVSIISSLVVILGAAILLLTINWKLALIVLTIIPLIGGTFMFVFSKVKVLFIKGRSVIDRLNKVINESILGAMLIRVLNSQEREFAKFREANAEARSVGFSILRLFTGLIPMITLIANLAALAIIVVGGRFVINAAMTLGDFAQFMSYLMMLIFPIIMLGFVSNLIAQASAAYERIKAVLNSVADKTKGTRTEKLKGEIKLEDVTLTMGEKNIVNHVSFTAKAGTKTAIIGPTAAGKTQLLHLLIGLMPPSGGKLLYDNHPLAEYDKDALHRQIGFVFQDSVLFNLTLRENIAFTTDVKDEDLAKAIATAELTDFVASLPAKLDTVVSERGTSLSGGQKQRIMLARALALNPKILLLDDFTARVDRQTEERILKNITDNYPDLTLVSVTQKVASVTDYNTIVLLMDGEVIAQGTHQELMAASPEYVQLYTSQESTHHYEVHS